MSPDTVPRYLVSPDTCGDRVMAFDGMGPLISKPVSHVFAYDDVAIHGYVTASGRSFRASPQHRTLAEDGRFLALMQLTPDQGVVGADGAPQGSERFKGELARLTERRLAPAKPSRPKKVEKAA